MNAQSALTVARTDDTLTLGHPDYDVAWDLPRGGALVYLRDRRSGVTLVDARAGGPGPDILVCVSTTLEEEERELRMSAMGVAAVAVYLTPDQAAARVEFAVANGEVLIERTVRLRADTAWIDETVAIKNISDRNLLVDRYPNWEAAGKTAVAGDLFHWGVNPGGVDYVLDGLAIAGQYGETEYVTPACGYPFFYNRGHFAEMGETAISLVAGHHGAVLPCAMAWNEAAGGGVMLACEHDRSLQYVRLKADQEAKAGSLALQVWWARWLAPGERQEVATWHLVPFAGDYGVMLDEYRHWLSDRLGLVPPADEASGLDEIFVACIHPAVLHALGHFEKFKPYVAAVAEVGCTAFWGAKIWLDSIDVDKRAWMSRCQPQTREYRYGVTPAYGGEAAARELLAYMREKGVKVVAWMTGYGLTLFDPLFKEHPEAFVRLRRPVVRETRPGFDLMPDFDPNIQPDDPYVYPPFGGTTVGGDTTNPHWREFWLHNQEYWAAHGVDGIFFDSFNPMPPNYALHPWPGQISQEIVNLQREARCRARAVNPDFFSFTEGGGYRMATVNDFTHTWHGITPPPLPPFRTKALSPAEEARFLRDEFLSMLPGARSWKSIANVVGDGAGDTGSVGLPRVLAAMFGGHMPVLNMFSAGAQQEPITNEVEFWTLLRPHPADDPAPAEREHWARVGAWWRLRLAHPELKSGRLVTAGVTVDNPGCFAFLREQESHRCLVVLNFHPEPVTCAVRVAWAHAGVEAPGEQITMRDLLSDNALPPTTAAALSDGYGLAIPARNGLVIKLTAREDGQ